MAVTKNEPNVAQQLNNIKLASECLQMITIYTHNESNKIYFCYLYSIFWGNPRIIFSIVSAKEQTMETKEKNYW